MEKTTTTTTTTFTDVLTRYERATRNKDDFETEYTSALVDLAKACTFSVLKKLANVGGVVTDGYKVKSDSTKSINVLRNGLCKDFDTLERLKYAVDNATEWAKDKDGNNKLVILDKDLYKGISDLLNTTLSDGSDLLQIAILSILEETEKVGKGKDFMTTPYTTRRLKKKVYIQKADSVNGWEDVETCAIKEVYKSVRRAIAERRTAQIASHVYAYIEYIATDGESGTEQAIFERLPKYHTAVDIVTDINGKTVSETASETTAETISETVASLNLTDKESTILKLRLCGYGSKAIATYLGISENSVKGARHRIASKATEKGLRPNR